MRPKARSSKLEQIFELLGKAARGKKCDAIERILDEGKEIIEEYADTPALDAGLLAAAQAVEHYEISRYGALKAWARNLNMPQAAKLLNQTLAEEKKTDDTPQRSLRRRSITKQRDEHTMRTTMLALALAGTLASPALAQSVGEKNSALIRAGRITDSGQTSCQIR
jgi:ferritin-like metal-binding protein YciE